MHLLIPCITEWALPDQLVFSTVSALIRIANSNSDYRKHAFEAIVCFTEKIVSLLKTGEGKLAQRSPGWRSDIVLAVDILTQIAPAFHGFYRAIISVSFNWSINEWSTLAGVLNALFDVSVADRLNRLLIDVIPSDTTEDDIDQIRYIQTFFSRYVARGRPLNGYFIVCCVTEAEWTILAQAVGNTTTASNPGFPDFVEAAAANKAWQALLRSAVGENAAVDEDCQQTLKMTRMYAMKSFSSLLVQIEELDTEPSEDSYAWETMSESLVGRLCDWGYHTTQSTCRRNWPPYVQLRWGSWTKVS